MITPLPFGEGKGEGPLTYRGISVITPLPLGEGKGEGPAGAGGGANFLLIIFSFREKAEYATRGGPSTSENMPFLHVEDALLDARRACSQFVFVTL